MGYVRSVNDNFPDQNGNVHIEGVAGPQGPPGLDGNTVVVEDSLDSTSTENALSANMGKALYDMADFISEELAEHKSEIASSVSLGHVRIDNSTIKIENDTKRIYVPNSGNGDPGLVNLSQTVLLSAAHVPSCLAVHNYTDTRFTSHNTPTTPSQMGHVMVDDSTIKVDEYGVISATQVPGPQGIQGPIGPQGVKGDKGDTGNTGAQGLIIPGESRQIKMWSGSTTIAGGSGEWTISYASAGFTEIISVQVTLESNITAAADKPLGTYIVSKSTTSASGKAYKATSAGLLTAMQQVAADNGVIVHVLVIGH